MILFVLIVMCNNLFVITIDLVNRMICLLWAMVQLKVL